MAKNRAENRTQFLSTKLVEYVNKAENFFWEEDACCPVMNQEQLHAAADKSTKIHGAIHLASQKLGVSHQDVADISNSLPWLPGERREERSKRIAEVVQNLHQIRTQTQETDERSRVVIREAKKGLAANGYRFDLDK